jgi:hypothetical protein
MRRGGGEDKGRIKTDYRNSMVDIVRHLIIYDIHDVLGVE